MLSDQNTVRKSIWLAWVLLSAGLIAMAVVTIHIWYLRFTQTDGQLEYGRVYGVLSAVTIISLLLFWLLIFLFNARFRAQQLADQLTVDVRKSEESYRNQFANNLAAMLLINPADGAIIEANAAAISFYGYPRDRLLTMLISDINTLPDTKARQAMPSVLPKQGKRFQFKHRLADNSVRNVEVLASSIHFGGRSVLHLIIHDISERKQVEEIKHNVLQTILHDTYERYQTEEIKNNVLQTILHDIYERYQAEETRIVHDITERNQAEEIKHNVLQTILHDINERNHAEKMLRQSTDRLTLAAQAGGVGIWDYDVVNNRLVWDEQMFHLYGITQDTFGGAYEAWQAVLHPEDRLMGDEEIQLALQGKKKFDTEFRVVWPDGTIRNIRALALVQRNAFGQPLHMTGTNWDITAQKLVEVALRESDANFRTFFESMTDMITVGMPDGRLLFTNVAVTQTLGYSSEELVAMHLLDIYSADKRLEAEEIFAAMLRGERESCLLPLIRKDGSFVPVETRIRFGQWNGMNCLFGISKNLTAEQEAQQRFERLFRNNPALMALTTAKDRRFTDVNDAFLKSLGYSRSEVIGKTAAELGLLQDAEQLATIAGKLKADGSVADLELAVLCKDGAILDGLFSGEAISIVGQQYFLTVMVDITARKRAEDGLRHANETLEQRIKERSRELEMFSYSVSHDLQAPLRHLIGFVELLNKKAPEFLDEKIRHYLTVISDSAKQMSMLVDGLLSFSRMGRAEMMVVRVNFDKLIHAVLNTLQTEIAERNIVWNIGPLPDVMGDPVMLQIVVMNLISNAIKFTRKKTRAEISITCTPGNAGEHIFSVRDNGAGFDMKHYDKLFNLFKRLHRTEDFEGTGVGLANVLRIIQRHGGRSWAKGVVGSGAVFYFSLPSMTQIDERS